MPRVSKAVAAQITAALKERDALAADLEIVSKQRDEFARKLAKVEYDLSQARKEAIAMLNEAHATIRRLERERNEARRVAAGRLAVAQEARASMTRLQMRENFWRDVRALAANDDTFKETM